MLGLSLYEVRRAVAHREALVVMRTRISALLPFMFFLCGCSRSTDVFADYTTQSGDLGAFVLTNASKLGARVSQKGNLPPLRAEWHYKEGSGSVQVYVVGNCLTQLHSFFTNAFGPPTKPLTKGISRGTETIGTFYGWTELGAGVWYSWYVTDEGKQFTQFSIHSESSLKGGR